MFGPNCVRYISRRTQNPVSGTLGFKIKAGQCFVKNRAVDNVEKHNICNYDTAFLISRFSKIKQQFMFVMDYIIFFQLYYIY
jgi:hypothetical protein